ncbi:hypothetical protein OVY48_21485 [Sphingobium sp. SA2]|uniref:hypothetical protein n=1 Tax=Sphingobium sp. SA2 TaxID=1524832 RepID=UPI0028C20237|nr:hypothetical protein [Sphingobium sp. SA2]MDT7535974.1 hypothetical protein [Sphingobium sp. SA2]
MAKLALALIIILGLLGVFGSVQARRRLRRLTTQRQGVHPSTLIDQLIQAGVRESVTEFIWDALSPYYGDGDILPHQDDDLIRDAGIDPEDIEDIVASFFHQNRLSEPTTDDPEHIPQNMSICALGHYLMSCEERYSAV